MAYMEVLHYSTATCSLTLNLFQTVFNALPYLPNTIHFTLLENGKGQTKDQKKSIL